MIIIVIYIYILKRPLIRVASTAHSLSCNWNKSISCPDAQVKRLYKIDSANLTEYSIVNKALVYDLLPPLEKTQGLVLGNLEGVAHNSYGIFYIVNDNGGVSCSCK